VATATTPAAATQPANAPIKLTLTGANEVPPVTSSATGTFLATAGVSSLGYTLTASGAATGFTMAHIHMGACGTNAPVVVLLFSNPTGAPTISVSGTVTDASLVGPLAGKTMKDFNDAMNSGLLYVNAHTLANPTGEIRACIAAAPTAPATGSGTAASSNSNFALFAALAGVAGLMTVAGTAAVTLRRRN
jgi:hypothetical protein